MDDVPRIIGREYTALSPYVRIVRKEVVFKPHSVPEAYHGLSGEDYVCMIALTDDGRIPLVRQFRPIIERFVWEFPAGTVEKDEEPEAAAIRELHEETGFRSARRPCALGTFAADTGRLEINTHGFFFAHVTPDPHWLPEEGVESRLFGMKDIERLTESGEFSHLMHIAYLYLAFSKGKKR